MRATTSNQWRHEEIFSATTYSIGYGDIGDYSGIDGGGFDGGASGFDVGCGGDGGC